MYAYMDQVLQQKNMMKIGTCKSRRSADVAVQIVPVNPDTHRIGDYSREDGSGKAAAKAGTNGHQPTRNPL